MDASPRSRSQVVLALGLLAVMIVLAVLQWRWIDQWSAVEETRLQSNLQAGGEALDAALGEMLHTLAERLRDDGLDEPLPDFLAARYLIEPGPTPRLLRLEPGLEEPLAEAWPEPLTAWRDYFNTFPAEFSVFDPRTLHINDADAPVSPPGLAVPILRPNPEGPIALRFALALFDTDLLETSLLPDLVGEHLIAADQFDVLITDAEGSVVYRSRPGLIAAAFDRPDLDRPLGPEAVTRLVVQIEAGEVNVFETARLTDGAEAIGRWRLQVQHRSGSIAEAIAGLRHRQLAIAFGVLLVLGLAAGLLVRSAHQAQRLAQQQMDFVAGVSHELRTPLAVIRSAGENLADGVVADSEQARRYGALVRDEGQRLSEMIENVLALAGADAQQAAPQRLVVSDIVEEAITQAHPLLDAAASHLTRSISDEAPAISGDRATLVAALRNLLANAARYGGPHISLRAEPGRHQDRPAVVLTVHDDGPGLDPVDLPHLFEPFYRGQEVREAQRPGSGLGLALVRRAAEAHGGTATASNASGGGSTFTLVLPAHPVAAS